MIVEEMMRTEVYTLKPTNTVDDAIKTMREKNIRHIPIVDDQDKVIGLVTSHDVKNVLPSNNEEGTNSNYSKTLLQDIMVKNPIIGHPLDFVEEVALTFYETKISCLPIVSGGKLVGIITTSDLLYSYIELTGANQPSSKLEIRVHDKPGELSTVTEVFKAHKANVLSLYIYPDSEHNDCRILSIRARILNPLRIIEDLRNKGFVVLWPNLPGVNNQ